MSGGVSGTQPRFSITPGSASASVPVTLTLPAGYKATAGLTNACGKPVGRVTVTGLTARPHLPAGYTGTSFVTWKITRKGTSTGLHMSMTLAARETIGHTTTCPHASPYTAHTAPAPLSGSGSLVVKPAAPAHFPGMAAAAGGTALLAVAVAAAVIARGSRRRQGPAASAGRRRHAR